MAEILTKNVIRADELLQLLRSLGIETKDISTFAQAYGFKKPKKVQLLDFKIKRILKVIISLNSYNRYNKMFFVS